MHATGINPWPKEKSCYSGWCSSLMKEHRKCRRNKECSLKFSRGLDPLTHRQKVLQTPFSIYGDDGIEDLFSNNLFLLLLSIFIFSRLRENEYKTRGGRSFGILWWLSKTLMISSMSKVTIAITEGLGATYNTIITSSGCNFFFL